MMYFFSAAIMAFFYLDFKLISVVLKRNLVYFHEHKKYGSGVVVGYDLSEGERWYSLIVKVNELNDNKNYICSLAKINKDNYPKGSIVNVVYAITKRGRVQVYLSDILPASESNTSKVCGIISVVSLIMTLGLAVAGIISTFF